MPTLQVDTLAFDFSETATAQIYDKWEHYTQVWNAPPGGKKAVDVVAVEDVRVGDTPPQATTWLIEAKDFRVITNPPKPSNIGGLAQLVADKASDTLTGLADAGMRASTVSEKSHAASALAAGSKRIVLHLEPHTGHHSALFPAGFAASVFQQLKSLVSGIDPNPLVLNIANTPAVGVPWSVS